MRNAVFLALVASSACTGWIGALEPTLPVPLEPSSCPMSVAAAAPTDAWTPAGPHGATVQAAAALGGGVVVVGTTPTRGTGIFYTRGGGLFRSADQGRSFSRVQAFVDTGVTDLWVDPQAGSVWAAAGSSGAWVSTDQGQTFGSAGAGLHAGARVRRVAGPGADRVWALVDGTEAAPQSAATTLYRKDGAGPWTRAAAAGIDPAPGGPLADIAAHPGFPDRLWAVDGARLYVSDDGGATFRVLASGAVLYGPVGLGGPRGLFADPADAAHLVLSTRDDGLMESTDSGATWQQRVPDGVTLPLAVHDVVFGAGELLVATGGAGVQRYAQGAWDARGACLLDRVVLALARAPDAPEQVVAGSAAGLSVSADGAARFEPGGAGLDGVLGRVFVTGAGADAAAWLASSAGVFRYAAAQGTWERVGDWGGALAVADLAFAPDGARAWLGVDEALFPGRYGVDDGLLEWSLEEHTVVRPAAPSGLAGGVGGVAADPTRAGTAYAYVRGDTDAAPAIGAVVLRRGPDGALSRTPLTGEALTDTAQFRFGPLASAPDGTLYAGVRLAGGAPALLRSDDGAQTSTQVWTQPGWVPHAVAVAPDGAVYLAGAYGNVGVRRSTDRGATFAAWDDGLPGAAKIVYALAFAPDGAVVAGTTSGVHWRAPGGTFAELGGFPSTVSVWSVAVLPFAPRPVVLAATDRGVFWRLAP